MRQHAYFHQDIWYSLYIVWSPSSHIYIHTHHTHHTHLKHINMYVWIGIVCIYMIITIVNIYALSWTHVYMFLVHMIRSACVLMWTQLPYTLSILITINCAWAHAFKWLLLLWLFNRYGQIYMTIDVLDCCNRYSTIYECHLPAWGLCFKWELKFHANMFFELKYKKSL